MPQYYFWYDSDVPWLPESRMMTRYVFFKIWRKVARGRASSRIPRHGQENAHTSFPVCEAFLMMSAWERKCACDDYIAPHMGCRTAGRCQVFREGTQGLAFNAIFGRESWVEAFSVYQVWGSFREESFVQWGIRQIRKYILPYLVQVFFK